MEEVDLMQLVTTGEHDEVLTTSRIVATEFGKRHDHVMRDIRAFKEDVPNFGEMFYEDKAKDSYGRDQKIFDMTRDGFSLLAMGFNGKKALQFKLKFIEAFNKMEEYIKNRNSTEMTERIPKTFGEALQLSATLQLEVEAKNKQIEEKDAKIEADKDKVQFAVDLATSDHSVLVGTFAKQLKQAGFDTGQNRLFEQLRKGHYLMSASGKDRYNLPTQYSIDQDLFEIKTSRHYNWGLDKLEFSYTPMITPKGQIYFTKKFLHENN